MYIQSSKNPRLKQWKKLEQRKEREKTQTYILEGVHLVEEALKAKAAIVEVMIHENFSSPLLDTLPPDKLITLSEEATAAIRTTEHSQGIFAVVQMDTPSEQEAIQAPYLFLDGVQDPGNVGTMIRTADAAGFAGVVLGDGCADLYNDKTLRSAQGSHFHLHIQKATIETAMASFQQKGLPVYGTALDPKAKVYTDVRPKGPFGLIMGNEGQGVRQDILDHTDQNLYIPIQGRAESLNVGVAAGILMFSLWADQA